MPNPIFGVGQLVLVPSGTNPTPVKVGILQNVSVDSEQALVELYGAYKFPVDLALGKSKISGKAQSAVIGSGTIAAILGGTVTGASKVGIADEVGTIPTTPFIITVANGANFYEDLGVVDTTTGLAMVRGATATGTGVYAVNTATGAYTFNTADSGHGVKISYSYTRAAAGKTVAVANSLMGAATTYTLNLYNTYKTKNIGIRLPAVVIPKLSMAFTNASHSMFDLEFTAQQDATGAVASYFAED